MTCERGCCPSPKEHFRSLVFVGGQATGPIHERDRRYDKDAAAYKRLRANGLQPPRIDGCAIIEARATTKEEVERGSVSPANMMKE